MRARQVVLLTPSRPSAPAPLLSRQHFVRVSPLAATLMDLPASVANKRLTAELTLLAATLTKNRGEGGIIVNSKSPEGILSRGACRTGPLLESDGDPLLPLPLIFVALRPYNSMEYSEPRTMNYGTLPSRFLNAIDNLSNPRAQMVRRDGRWETIGSEEFLRRVAGLSSAFVELGVKPGDRVGLFSANRPEWHTADFAITGAGAVTVPVYFNESLDRMTYILKHCGAKVLFVAGKPQLEKVLAVRGNLPELEQVIVADGGTELPSEYLRYETLVTSAGVAEVSAYRQRAAQVLPGQLASIIYTSGTTGEPKGVMLTHTNFCSNVTDVGHEFRIDPAKDVALSFLPLTHVYGRVMDYIYLFQEAPIAYVESVDAVAQALLEVRPSVTAAVPRFFEKLYVRLVEQGSKTTGIKRKIFAWAMKVASQSVHWRASGGHASLAVKLQWLLADWLV